MIQPGEAAPDFELVDLQGVPHRLASMRGTPVLLNFWAADCPHSLRADVLLHELMRDWKDTVAVWWIAANPHEPRAAVADAATARRVEPLLLDADQGVVDRYGAQTTPHCFLIDAKGVLRYAGAPDDVGFGRRQPAQAYLAQAVAAVLEGRTPTPDQTSPFGCAIVRMPPGGSTPDG